LHNLHSMVQRWFFQSSSQHEERDPHNQTNVSPPCTVG
jgi:hypothetical protein